MIDRQVVGCLGHGGGAGGRDSSPRVCDGDGRNYQEATVLGLLWVMKVVHDGGVGD